MFGILMPLLVGHTTCKVYLRDGSLGQYEGLDPELFISNYFTARFYRFIWFSLQKMYPNYV